MKSYLAWRYRKIDQYIQAPIKTQELWFKQLLTLAKKTEYGRKYNFKRIKDSRTFAEAVPMSDYTALQPYINRMMRGEENILWPGRVKWFSKSSGTTSGKSKFIPVPPQNLKKCHIKGTLDAVTLYYKHYEEARLFADRSLLMGGSHDRFKLHPSTRIGDISAIMIHNMPSVARPFFTPDFETALLDDWEEKIERMAQTVVQTDVAMFGGVPTWTIVLFKRMLELTGKSTIREIWPNVSVYMHGGVGFEPYRKTFEALIGDPGIDYQEVYNASEGFFGLRNEFDKDDMLLLLDNGVYYEFMPLGGTAEDIIPLSEVKKGHTYAMIITTNGGLWRYKIGDTITFTSTFPFKFKIAGRTTQFINAFGEEVIVANTDKALAITCRKHNVEVVDYTVAPVYLNDRTKGRHQWIIEFKCNPIDIDGFARDLDMNLQLLNTDYQAKRTKDIALGQLDLHIAESGTFHDWMKSKGRYGGQHKVPRLSNNREIIEDLLSFIKQGA